MRTGKHTLYIHDGDPLDQALSTREEGSVTQAVQDIACHYLEIVARSLPGFTAAEWGAIAESLWRTSFTEPVAAFAIPVRVASNLRARRLDEKWGVDRDLLMGTLLALRYDELLSTMECVSRLRGDGRFPSFESSATWADHVARTLDQMRAGPHPRDHASDVEPNASPIPVPPSAPASATRDVAHA